MNKPIKHHARRTAAQPRPILVVENHRAARNALKDLLESHGHSVVSVESGQEALRVLRKPFHPCLILLNASMPRQSAYRFRREQLKDPRLFSIPLVAYSGLYDPSIAAAHLHATAYFRTPFDVERLLKVVDAHCQRQAA